MLNNRRARVARWARRTRPSRRRKPKATRPVQRESGPRTTSHLKVSQRVRLKARLVSQHSPMNTYVFTTLRPVLFQDNKENGVEVVNEVGGGDSSEKKDSSEKSDEKWKKNYVPYQEPEEDSNKQ